ncbi:MAG: heme-binding protein [Limimaricola sp.]|uniref:SOUL family heme-binding protein n=1 Tax=Limimaricola sp. TaxID=2211665 RepID=UPI001DB5982F|nr:heme-binding protein [Limimaricola sp.]MBI1418762.1 heme-binding protein [Limimaricola sp.]
MSTTLSRFATLVAGAGIAGQAAADPGKYNGYEAPPYSVERQLDGAEIRAYAPYIVAEVTVRGPSGSALNQGFRMLAGYIFGGNQGQAKVAMTTPVTQTAAPEKIDMTVPVTQTGGDGVWTVTFMMPRQYTLDTLPKPNNDAIRFVQIPAERQVVLGFSGWATAGRVARKTAALDAIVAREGLDVTGPVRTYYYDAPFTLPWKRRNEVAYLLK